MFGKKARLERLETVKALMKSSKRENESVCTRVQKLERYIEKLKKFNLKFDDELVVDIVLASLPTSYDQFILNYHMKEGETTLTELHDLLKKTESSMKQAHEPRAAPADSQV